MLGSLENWNEGKERARTQAKRFAELSIADIMISSPIFLRAVLALTFLCGPAAAQRPDGCPEQEPADWSPCTGFVSCNLGDAYGGDPYCWKACDGEWWTVYCEDPPPDDGGKGEEGCDGGIGPQKPFQCSTLTDCASCLDHPSCDGWAGGFGCFSTCSYDPNDAQSLNVADVACYDAANGGCEAEATNAADYQICSGQTTCDGCVSTSKSGGGSCLWFADDNYDFGGFCSNTVGMWGAPVDSCPAPTEDTVGDESEFFDMPADCQPQQEAFAVCFLSSREPACEGFLEAFETSVGELPPPLNCEEAEEEVCSAMAGCCDKEAADVAACAVESSFGLDCDIDCGGDGPTSGGIKVTSNLLGLLIVAIGGALL